MKGSLLKSLGVAAVLMVALLLIVSSGASAEKNGPDLNWEEKIPKLTQAFAASGFSLRQAGFEYVDLVDMNCKNQLFTALANNPWPNAYLVMTDTQRLEDRTDPLWKMFWDKYPWFWQLREDEAFVLVGQTPPETAYFSFGTTAMFGPGDPWKPNPWMPSPMRLTGVQVGDNFNNLTIRTIGPTAYEAPIVYIITGNRETERRVRAAVRAAGYPDAMINVETISPVIAPLGIGMKGSIFFTVARAAVAKDQEALIDYIKDPPMKAFRLTPVDPSKPGAEPGPQPVLPADPEPVPILRVKGTGHTEMELWPAVQRLRQAILERYAKAPQNQEGYDFKELDTKMWTLEIPLPENDLNLPITSISMACEKSWTTTQRGKFAYACHRDNNYLATYPNFELLPEDDAFVIVYGVNHQATQKAAYSSFSLYADPNRQIGIGTKTSPNFDAGGEAGDSARYFMGDDPDAPYLYAWKVARHCAEDEPFCMKTGVEQTRFERPNGEQYQCSMWLRENSGLFFIFRNYMEPSTKVGPDDNELVYDRAIYFGPHSFPVECPNGCGPED